MLAGVCTVSNTNDSGLGSLRAAIDCSNGTPDVQTIDFNIPGAGTHTIRPNSPLPALTDVFLLDGSTQPGFSGTPIIELDGTNAGAGTNGLTVTAGTSVIRGLVINRFSGSGLVLQGGSNVVDLNYIGTNVAGTSALANGKAGLLISGSSQNIIGLPFGEPNVISGNTEDGILISGAGATQNTIRGNFIGTNAAGTAAVGNATGVRISNAPANEIGNRAVDNGNVISGNTSFGVHLTGAGSTGNVLANNTIGTNAAGTAALPNQHGVYIVDAPGNTIGGTAAGASNLISGNTENGVRIQGSGATGNVIEGNYIGTNSAGAASIGNGDGILLFGDANGNMIGGTSGGSGNVVSANLHDGIRLTGAATTNNVIQANKIGTDPTGSQDLGNAENGIFISAAANLVGGAVAGSGNLISGNEGNGIEITGNANSVQGNLIGTDQGGTSPLGNTGRGVLISGSDNEVGTNSGNVISANALEGVGIAGGTASGNLVQGNVLGGPSAALGNRDGVLIVDASGNSIGGANSNVRNQITNNSRDGVRVTGETADGNSIRRNNIFDNQQLGIDINGDGASANDSDDADTGANQTQNTPDIASATRDGSNNLTLTYAVSSTTANAAYPLTVEFFFADVDGEEGQDFIGSDVYTAANAGAGKTITFDAAVGAFIDDAVVATATDASGNTSEFSASVVVIDGGFDFGDAEDPAFPTLEASVGARHAIVPRFFLGATIDAEADGQPTANADGDDLDGNNDDDGVAAGTLLIPGIPTTIEVTVTDPDGIGGFLDAWIDSDGDGMWTHPDELIVASQPVTHGTNFVSVTLPASPMAGPAAARFRLSSAGSLSPLGMAPDGEVEDYILTIAATQTFVVDSEGDDGDANPGDGVCDDGAGNCTFRAAIEETNALPNPVDGFDVIAFNITGFGTIDTIQPQSALPSISDVVVIDATTDPDYDGTPVIQLDGSLAGDVVDGVGVSGLTISGAGGGSTIRGLAINRFSGHGIFVSRRDNNRIEANHIGTDPSGTVDMGNGMAGVYVINGENNAIFDNVIAGNDDIGVLIEGPQSTGNMISSNRIGTDVTGAVRLRNTNAGVDIAGSPGNIVGGTSAAAGNVISGSKVGVSIRGAAATGNVVQGNLIGSNATGTAKIANTRGVLIEDADNNTIGGAGTAGNVISGNTKGVFLNRGDDNLIHGNKIGTTAAGDAALANVRGVLVTNSVNNQIGEEPNVISGNVREGVKIFGPATTGNVVRDNRIGTNAAGDAAIGNREGVIITSGAGGNTVGGADGSAGNVISGNRKIGIFLLADNNDVQGNLIGTNSAGDAPVGNETGILIRNSGNHTIGGTTAGARNVISGNDDEGILIDGNAAATGNHVEGNYIGTNSAGSGPVPNKYGVSNETAGNTVGGAAAGAGNLISGNSLDGVLLDTATASGNTIAGNRIGMDATNSFAVPNAVGILVDGAPNNVIGGTAAGAGNSIAGNTQQGVKITGHSATGNTVQGNSVGRVAGSATAIPNKDGIRVADGASGNVIGGTAAGAANEVANNTGTGIWINDGTGNRVSRNSTHDNNGLGIAIGSQNPQANDDGDADTGANNLQNFPEIELATLSGGTLTIRYALSSATPNTAYPVTIEFFVADFAGEEGEVFIGSRNISSAGTTTSSIAAGGVTFGDQIVATATDANGNTSEFSMPVTVTSPPAAASQQSRALSVESRELSVPEADASDSSADDDLMYPWLEAGISHSPLEASLADAAFAEF